MSPSPSRSPAPVELNSSLAKVACAYPSCRTHSFLPTTCTCLLSFCPDHAHPPAAHDCPVAPVPDNIAAPGERNRFELKFNDLLPDRNRRVDRTVEDVEREARKERARVVLAGHEALVAKQRAVAGAPPQVSAQPPLKKQKLSPALELMRLKQKAKPADLTRKNVDLADRLFLNVEYRDPDELIDTREVWLAKSTNAGRALDLFAEMFAIANVNGTSHEPSEQLSLCAPGPPLARVANLSPVSVAFTNGGTAVLIRGFQFQTGESK